MLPINQVILGGTDPLLNTGSPIDFWFDDVDFGEDKLWKYFNELK